MLILKKFKCIFCLALAASVVFITSCSLEQTKQQNLSMSEEKYDQLCNDMYANTTPDLVFADEEKVVLHLLDGIFVYNYAEQKMENRFDISSLNCTTNMQGSCILEVMVIQDGETALLANLGTKDETAQYDNYYLNLETGTYEETIDEGMEGRFDSYEKDESGELVYPMVAIVGDKKISCTGGDDGQALTMADHKLVITENNEKKEIYLFK